VWLSVYFIEAHIDDIGYRTLLEYQSDSLIVEPCLVSFCTGHFVMVPLNLTYLHCLQHSLFEHLFNLYYQYTSIQLNYKSVYNHVI